MTVYCHIGVKYIYLLILFEKKNHHNFKYDLNICDLNFIFKRFTFDFTINLSYFLKRDIRFHLNAHLNIYHW